MKKVVEKRRLCPPGWMSTDVETRGDCAFCEAPIIVPVDDQDDRLPNACPHCAHAKNRPDESMPIVST